MGDVIAMPTPERVHKCDDKPRWVQVKCADGSWALRVPTTPPTAGRPLDYMRGWLLVPLVFCPWCAERLAS